MSENTSIQKIIVERVQSFCDDIIAGRTDTSILEGHLIPGICLDICRNPEHPSCKKMQNKLFQHLMMRIGYYKYLGDETKQTEILVQLDDLLYKPLANPDDRPVFVPQFVWGVKRIIGKIEKLENTHSIDFPEKNQIEQIKFGKEKRGFGLSYKRKHGNPIVLEEIPNDGTEVVFGDDFFYVPSDGGHVESRSWTFTQNDEISVRIDKLRSSCIDDNQDYYFRYITKVDLKDDSCREIQKHLFDVDGSDSYVIKTAVNRHQLIIYNYKSEEQNYLIIEYDFPMRAMDMRDFCFSVLVALGMITTKVHLNECWLAAYSSVDKKVEDGVYYQALTDSIQCNYHIFSSNVYWILVNVANQIDPVKGEKRACDIISDLKLSCAIPDFPCEVFGRLVENMVKYEELQRGIFIILMGSRLHLEIQAAIYCVALEAISNLAPKIIGEQQAVIISDTKAWKTAHKRLKKLTTQLCEENIISEEEKKDLDKKIDSINKSFNSEKLRSLLVHYQYPLKQFDELTLFLRNLLLHGNIKFKVLKNRKPEDYLFELSMNLHKLCCAIALLMSGYNGYIINNRKYYGYPNSYKAFIRIGDNQRHVYPAYQKEENIRERLSDALSGFWQRVLAVFKYIL